MIIVLSSPVELREQQTRVESRCLFNSTLDSRHLEAGSSLAGAATSISFAGAEQNHEGLLMMIVGQRKKETDFISLARLDRISRKWSNH